MKLSSIVYFILLGLSIHAQEELKIKATCFVNGKPIKDVKYYTIGPHNTANQLVAEEDYVIIKDTFSGNAIPVLAHFGKHIIVFPFYNYRTSKSFNIYRDQRIFGNETEKNFLIGNFRYLFKNEYYVEIESFNDLIIVFKPRKKYKLLQK